MHVDSWWDSYLEHGGTPKNLCVYIYIAMYIRFEHQVWESFYYMNIQCRTTTIFKIYYIYTGFSKMHVDSWWILTQNMEEPQNLCVYIYSDVHTIRTSGLESFYYMNIQCRTTTIFKIYYIYTGFSKCTQIAGGILTQNMEEPPKPLCIYIYIYSDVHTIRTSGLESFYYMSIQCRTTTISKYIIYTQDFQNARRQLVGFLLRTWRNPHKPLCIYYIQRCTYDSNIRFGKFLLYEQCRTTTIFKIYYIYTGFSKMHVDSWWDSYLEHGGTPKTSVYIYIAMYIRFEHQVWKVFYYMNIQCRTTTIFKIYYIYTGFSKMHVDSWWDSYLEHGGTEEPQNLCVYIYSDVHTIRTSGLESFYYMTIQCRTTTIIKIYYIYTGFSKMHVDSWWDSYLEHGGTPKTSVYIYIAMYIRFKVFII